MKRFLTLFLLSISLQGLAHKSKQPKPGRWIFQFETKNQINIPIEVYVLKNKTVQVKNNTEELNLTLVGKSGDTCIYEFPDFYSQLFIVWKSKKSAVGYYWNRNKPVKQTINLTGSLTTTDKFSVHQETGAPIQLHPKYQASLSPNDAKPEPAVALFEQKGKELNGSFLTETGDYRFLSGNVYGNKLYISCLDGSHLFMITGEVKDGKIQGKFYSGLSYQTDWIGQINDNYKLEDPYKLTYKVEEKPIQFEFEKLTGGLFSYPKDSKPAALTIVQIMGTWCPNCIDETKYYLQLHEKYASRGLNILVVGFEYSENTSFHKERLQAFQKRYNIPFEILIGGQNNKDLTAKRFPFLNGIMSYPTSLFLDKNGNLIKTHTGFNGPGTGSFYEEYKKEMESFLEQVLPKP